MTAEEAIAENEMLEDGRVTEEFRQDLIGDLKCARVQCSNLLTGKPDADGVAIHVKDHEERGRLIAMRVLLNDTLRTLEAEI